MENDSKIWRFLSLVVLMVISFLVGAKVEQNSHAKEIVENWNTIETQEAGLDQFEHNADYNAMFNYKAKELTEPCRKCSTKLSDYQVVLDSIEQFKGELVVPEAIRNTK